MTENELELLRLVREAENVEQAIETAINIMLAFLEQDGSSQEQPPVSQRVSA